MIKPEYILTKDEIVAYHGSRGGIEGGIMPSSRVRCDFGKGFYMGTNPEQVKGLVVEDASPVFYTLKINLNNIARDRILLLDGMQWVYAVLANRGKVSEFSALDIAKKAIETVESYEFIVGPIADDRMNEAMRRFSMNGLTDKGLLACLESVDYGYQIVAKTESACKSIEILSERDIYGQEADSIRQYVKDKRNEGRNIVDKMAREYVRDGKYLSELIDGQMQQENQETMVQRRLHGR